MAGVIAAADGVLDAALAAFFLPRLRAGQRLAVGLSGGRDSVVLLHLLQRLQQGLDFSLQLSACHIHHGLSAHADAWAAFSAAYCARLKIPCQVVRVQVDRSHGTGLEAAARAARYQAFCRLDVEWLALAQHRDDQAETLLLNLLRGSGVPGLAAMPEERPLAAGSRCRLLRPLLTQPAELLARHAAAHGLQWVEDESNADLRLRRNFLRHQVLPALRTSFPAPDQNLARAAGLAGEASRLLDELALIDRASVLAQPPASGLVLARLATLSAARGRNLLRHELARAGWRPPSQRWLAEALALLLSPGPDARVWKVHADGVLTRCAGHLRLLSPASPACMPPVTLDPVRWQGEARLPWGAGWVIFTPALGAGLSARWLAEQGRQTTQNPTEVGLWLKQRAGGERFCPNPQRPRRALKKILNEAALPAAQRQQLPLLWRGDELLWVGGLGVDVRAACAPGEAGWEISWQPGVAQGACPDES